MSNHDELLSTFTDITDTDTERATFYLESSAWQLEVALARFYEDNDPSAPEDDPVIIEDHNQEVIDVEPEPKASDSSDTKSGKAKPKSRFATIDSLKKMAESSDEEEGQAFYAGGSTHSGQQVLGPGKKKDIVSEMFKSCQKQSDEQEPSPSSAPRPSTFGGTGYKLGQTSCDTEVVPGTSSRPNPGAITLKLWQDGFTVNDRKLRPYCDPENKEFLDAIKRGEIPLELRQEVQGAEIQLDMEDHRHETYVAPKIKVAAFTGKGQMLGSPSPATVGTTGPIVAEDQNANESQAREELNVDTSQPMTTIQIRFADGSNTRAQFNLTHTIADIRQFVSAMRPQYATREYVLSTTYPTKELSDESQSIADAKLQNSAIMQRLK